MGNMRSAEHIRICTFLMVVLAFFCLGSEGCGASDGDEPSTRIVATVSDVHFNPFYDPTVFNALVAAEAEDWEGIFENSTVTAMPAYGQESNYPLLKRALDAAAASAPNPAFVVFPGDILRHHFNATFQSLYGPADQILVDAFSLKTVKFFILQMSERFGAVPVLFTPGNNDSYAGDYDLVPGGTFLADTAGPFYQAFLKHWIDEAGFNATWTAGGYFASSFGKSDMEFISLNSVLFSTHRPAPAPGDAAYVQLDWFESRLASANASGKTVYVATHIPPGADAYGTKSKYMNATGGVSNMDPMWHAAYQDRFLGITDAYRHLIKGFFCGHTHMDEFRLVYDANRTGIGTPVWVAPGVSPIFGQNPGFKTFTVHAGNLTATDYALKALDLANASTVFAAGYTFTTEYPVAAPDAQGMTNLFPLLASNATVKNAYIADYYLGSPRNPINATNWQIYRCAAGYLRNATFTPAVNAAVD